MQENYDIFKDLLQTVLLLLFVLELFKKKKTTRKMTSWLVIFRAFFVPSTLNLKNNSRKSTN